MLRGNISRYLLTALAAALITFGISTAGFAATYYVATSGSDSNPGTSAAPFRTVQKGLSTVQPGDTCLIRGGTYNESLALGQSGTSTAKITIQNYPGETVTINSGSSIALRTNGRKHYYVISGLRFISTYVGNYSLTGKEYTLDFENGIWDGFTDSNGGNNGFTLKNCYIEGSVHFYGHYNLMENCELNGKAQWGNGVFESFAASHHNTYRGNKVYGYTNRGIWSMQYTDSVVIENNVIHDTGNMGIDCDGAGHPVYNSIVRGNTIYNVGGRGIEMENAFNSVTERNVIFNSNKWGINYINYGFGPDYNSDAEYRDDNTNAIIRNNLIYNTAEAGIILNGAAGIKIYNNTIYRNYPTKGYFAGISLCSYGGYTCVNTSIRNNIVSESDAYAIWVDSPTLNLSGLVMSNNLYYHSTKTKTHYFSNNGSYTLAEYRSATGQESGSIFSNPLFVNIANGDFHLSGTSPAVDAGATLSEVTIDLDGYARPLGARHDIGAYELSSGGDVPVDPTPDPTDPQDPTDPSALLPPQNLRVIG